MSVTLQIVNLPPHNNLQTQRHLAHLQLSVSTSATLKKMDEFCIGYDGPVKAWKTRIEQTLKGKCDIYIYAAISVDLYIIVHRSSCVCIGTNS